MKDPRYPPDWKTIALAKKQSVNWKWPMLWVWIGAIASGMN
jgi:hypothetical protein